MRIVTTVEEVYRDFKDVVILHGISPNGALSTIPESVTFSERIQSAIDRSQKDKICAFSIRFGKGSIDNRVFGYTVWGSNAVISSDIFERIQGLPTKQFTDPT